MKKGANSIEIKNSIAVVREVRPVFLSTATQAEDSTNVVVVEVPKIAPAVVAMESASSAGLIFGSFPSLSSISALVLTPDKSSKSIKKVYQQE